MTTAKDKVMALDLPMVDPLPPETEKYFAICEEKLGLIPNVLKAHAFDINKLNAFVALYNDLMLADSGLTKLEREMIAVAVSSVNHCFYCMTAHGSAVRRTSKDPALGELMVMNYRIADLEPRQRAMLDFAVKLTEKPHEILEEDRKQLRNQGYNDEAIWDICAVAAFFNMSNRMAAGVDMQPNKEYHSLFRDPPSPEA